VVFSSAEAARGILCSSLRADVSSARLLERTMWGTRFPFPQGTTDLSGSLLKMDGRQVYTFAVKAVAEGMAAMLASAGLFGAGLTYGGNLIRW